MLPYHLKQKKEAQEKFEALLLKPWSEFLQIVGETEGLQIKRRMYLECQGRCDSCNLYEWMETPINFELEHVDGNNVNNERNNLKLLCPNCHSMTDTWRGRNRKVRKNISDEDMIQALKAHSSIRKALMSVGIAGKGDNYKRAYELIVRHNIQLVGASNGKTRDC